MKKHNMPSIDGQKIFDAVSCVGLSFGATSILSLMTGIYDSPHYLAFITGGTIIFSPLIHFGVSKIKSKTDINNNSGMHHIGQLSVMMKETLEKDRIIGRMTSSFLPEILEVLKKENKDFPEEELMNINQLLYLINCNYYDKINATMPAVNREQLIKLVINQVSAYLKNTEKKIFNEKDAKKVLQSCFFISTDLKEDIAHEFKKAKRKLGKMTIYEIVRNDIDYNIDEYLIQKEAEVKGKVLEFDINNYKHYKKMIEIIENSDFFKELGNPSGLKWDIDLLKKVITIIAKNHHEQLLKINQDYSNFKMTTSFMYNVTSYALVNNRNEVGKDEIINTFKNWDYLPLDIKLEVLDEVFKEEQLDYSDHPYKMSKPNEKKPYEKIIKFSPKNN